MHTERTFPGRHTTSALLLALLTVSAPVAIAAPVGETTPGEAKALKCLAGVQASIRATPPTVNSGQATTISWTSKLPSGCANLRLYVGPNAVGRAGMLTAQPLSNARFALRASYGSIASAEVAVVQVGVILPPVVTISDGTVPNIRWLLVQALGTPGQVVNVTNNVELDLTGLESIDIAEGVVFQGGRTSREPGPRLFSTTRANVLFGVTGNNVRIAGLRIEGPEMGVSDADDSSRAIMVDSRVNVDIGNNEISGWSGAAISVWDTAGVMAPTVNPTAVRIHDNYIHHNQHVGGNGYGVAVAYGAHPSITRNVFDWNRHAIEGDGRSGTGYEATANLVLPNGGLHRWVFGFWVRTHQFDMHAQGNCGIADIWSDSLWNCGLAGGLMTIRQNTFLYTDGAAIKLRGTPEVGMYVGGNMFAAPLLLDTCTTKTCVTGAVRQNERGLVIEPGNLTGVNGSRQLGRCDFDGDGTNDAFMATGATWWYSSGGVRPWTYLNTSPRRLSEVQLGYFDSDRRCDVFADGLVYSGGTTFRNTFAYYVPGSGGVLAR